MTSAQETTVAIETVVDSSGNTYNSPRIVGGQDVKDRSQYAYQVSMSIIAYHFGFITACKIDKIENTIRGNIVKWITVFQRCK